MAKLAPGIRLLRSLAKAGKAQQKAVTRLLAAATPKPVKSPRKSASRKAAPRKAAPQKTAATSIGAPATEALKIRKHERPDTTPAPGKWLAAQFPLPLASGQAVLQHMSYWLYLPQQVPDTVAQDGWPLVVMLHGCHQSATQFAQGTRMNRLAEDKGFAVLYPQQLLSNQAQRCWRWFDHATQQGGRETAALAALIGKMCEQYPVDRRRIYACGISAGAGMAAVLALNHPELIAAVGLHSGPVFGAGHSPIGALHVMRHGAPAHADAAIRSLLRRRSETSLSTGTGAMPPMPALLIQGDDDKVVHAINQQQLARQWLQLNGLALGAAARVTVKRAGRGGRSNAYEISDYLVGRKVILRVARIAGLGHEWSGGDPALKFNAKTGPDASRMMLEFFSRHRR
jgi:poly(hydroxyalkanoate) depolymerase family esterase